MFNKPLDEITYEDIKKLRTDKVPESKVLDYKLCYNKEKKDLLKHVCGFANANGGFLVFGIEEDESKPAIPKNLTGLNERDFNIERIEQIINDNLDPRLKVEISPPIYKKDKKGKFFVVIRIPEGPDKPYMSTVDDRFYFRHNYQTRRMSEIEISSMYRQRFSSPTTVKEYIKETVDYNANVTSLLLQKKGKPIVFGHFFIFPTNLEIRRIKELETPFLKNLPEGFVTLKALYFGRLPSRHSYNQFGIEWNDGQLPPRSRLEIHRNGLIHNVKDYGSVNEKGRTRFAITDFTGSILSTLEYASWFYGTIGYFAPVILMIKLFNTEELLVNSLDGCQYPTKSKKIEIERECNSWELKENIIEITSNMMDEFMNYFGKKNYWGFRMGGEFGHLLDSDKQGEEFQ